MITIQCCSTLPVRVLHLITFKQHKWGVKPEPHFHTGGLEKQKRLGIIGQHFQSNNCGLIVQCGGPLQSHRNWNKYKYNISRLSRICFPPNPQEMVLAVARSQFTQHKCPWLLRVLRGTEDYGLMLTCQMRQNRDLCSWLIQLETIMSVLCETSRGWASVEITPCQGDV